MNKAGWLGPLSSRLSANGVLGVCRIAHDPAKVEDQVQFLARTLETRTLKPDGMATACKAV